MPLSKSERLILANQYKILESLEPSERDYAKAIEALENGYELAIDDLFSSIFEGLSSEQCRFVIKSMAMYDALQRSYKSLADKKSIEARKVKFPGFDGNNETELMSYAQFVVEREERFTYLETGDDGFNSHTEMSERYRAMLAVWHSIEEPYDLSSDQMARILDAR